MPDAVKLRVEVRNIGERAGEEVVQLYASRPMPGVPVRSLWGFQRVSLKPGEAKTLTFSVDARAMSVVGKDGNRIVEPGEVDFWVGGGEPVERPGLARASGAAARVIVTGRKAIPRF